MDRFSKIIRCCYLSFIFLSLTFDILSNKPYIFGCYLFYKIDSKAQMSKLCDNIYSEILFAFTYKFCFHIEITMYINIFLLFK